MLKIINNYKEYYELEKPTFFENINKSIEKKGWVKFEPTHSNERNYQRIKGNHIRLSEGIFTYRGLNTNQRIHWWWNWKGQSIA